MLFEQTTFLSQKDLILIKQAIQRKEAIDMLRLAFSTNDPQIILQSHDEELLKNTNLLTYDDFNKIKFAQLSLNNHQTKSPQLDLQDDIHLSLPDDEKNIINLWLQGMIKEDLLNTDADYLRLRNTVKALGRITRIKRAVQQRNVERLKRLYFTKDISQSPLFPPDLREKVKELLQDIDKGKR